MEVVVVETAAVTNGAYTVICYGESDNTAVLVSKEMYFVLFRKGPTNICSMECLLQS